MDWEIDFDNAEQAEDYAAYCAKLEWEEVRTKFEPAVTSNESELEVRIVWKEVK